MKVLAQAQESERRINLLLSLTSIRSEPTIQAIHDHLVRGLSENAAVTLNGIQQSNFNRALTTLNETAEIVEKIKECDWRKFKSDK